MTTGESTAGRNTIRRKNFAPGTPAWISDAMISGAPTQTGSERRTRRLFWSAVQNTGSVRMRAKFSRPIQVGSTLPPGQRVKLR
jgi:hypothetical protein